MFKAALKMKYLSLLLFVVLWSCGKAQIEPTGYDPYEGKIGVGHREINAIASDPGNYEGLIGNIDFITLYINKIKSTYSDEELQQLANIVNENSIETVIEMGGVLGPVWGKLGDIENGKKSALAEIQNVGRWVTAGGKIDYVIFDDPVRRLLYGDNAKNIQANNGVLVSGYFNETRGPYSYEEVAEEILACMQEWRKVHPDVQFILGCNFPNWGWKGQQDYHKRNPDGMNYGDYWDVIQVLLDNIQNTEYSLSGFIADFPFNYLIGERDSPVAGNNPSTIDWALRVRELEDYVRSRGLDFYLYTNTEEQESDTRYSDYTLRYIDFYREIGGKPDAWNFQSWYDVPKSFGPDSEQYSMAWLVNMAVQKLNEGN
jgi:hypothetical protein